MVRGVTEIQDPVEAGAPLLPGQDSWRLHCQSSVGSAPGVRQVCGHLLCQTDTVKERHFHGFPVPCWAVSGGQPIPAPGGAGRPVVGNSLIC